MSQPDSARSPMVEATNEDSRIVGAILKQAGDQLSIPRNGTHGRAIAAKSLGDLILIRIRLPPVDGFTACRRFKGEARGLVELRGIRDGVAGDPKYET